LTRFGKDIHGTRLERSAVREKVKRHTLESGFSELGMTYVFRFSNNAQELRL
jgi:hypothetical protein